MFNLGLACNVLMNASMQSTFKETMVGLPNLQPHHNKPYHNSIIVVGVFPTSNNDGGAAITNMTSPAGFGDHNHDDDADLGEEEPQDQIELSLNL